MKRRFLVLLSFLVAIVGLSLLACGGPDVDDTTPTTAGTTTTTIPEVGIYVTTSGDDANTGESPAESVLSIQIAIEKAVANGYTNIFIAEGSYTPGNGLNPLTNGVVLTNDNLNLLGGWNADFSSQSGYSVLDGTNGIIHLVHITNASDISIERLALCNGYADTTSGILDDGTCFSIIGCANVLIQNTFQTNNYAHGLGTCFFVLNSTNIIIDNTISIGNICANAEYFISGGLNVYILNNIITNNILSVDSRFIIGLPSPVVENLVISNNLLGGTNNNLTWGAIKEVYIDTVNHVIMDNIFITNTMGLLYSDDVNGVTNDIAAVNDTAYSGAAIASGNIVTNM